MSLQNENTKRVGIPNSAMQGSTEMGKHAKSVDADLYCDVAEHAYPRHRRPQPGDMGTVSTTYGAEIEVRITESYKSGFLAERVNDPYGLPLMGPFSAFNSYMIANI